MADAGTETGRSTSRLRRSTIGDIDARHNSLNALRLVLAALVVVSHAWPLGGYGAEPVWGRFTVGTWAVAGFFTISGWLLTESRLTTPLSSFIWRRVIRIYPAYLAALVLVGFGFSVLGAALGRGDWHAEEAVSFLLRNLGLMVQEFTVGDTLRGTPYPGAWIGSLWTLFFEFLCYLAIAVLVSVVSRRWLPAAVVTVWVLASGLTLVLGLTQSLEGSSIARLAQLASFFFAGAALWCVRRATPRHFGLVLACVGLIAVAGWVTWLSWFCALPAAYLCLWLGQRLPLHRVGRRNDVSYGLYIYAFPVQQIAGLLGLTRWGPLVFAGIALVGSLPFAAASWFAIERPAIRRLRGLVGGEYRSSGDATRPAIAPLPDGHPRQLSRLPGA